MSIGGFIQNVMKWVTCPIRKTQDPLEHTGVCSMEAILQSFRRAHGTQ